MTLSAISGNEIYNNMQKKVYTLTMPSLFFTQNVTVGKVGASNSFDHLQNKLIPTFVTLHQDF